jgi:hypothetical protein
MASKIVSRWWVAFKLAAESLSFGVINNIY